MKYIFINDFSILYFFKVATSVIPSCRAIRFVSMLFVWRERMEGTLSQIFNLGPSFYFMT